MIISQLLGGLGNQMFQYAAAYALARRCGVPCRVDLREFQLNPRPYELDRFAEPPQSAAPEDLPKAIGLWRARMVRLSARFGLPDIFTPANQFTESGAFRYDRRFDELRDPAYLTGYFQSERYFGDVVDEIRRIYTFREPLSGPNADLAARMAAQNTVSVHVRRGDYVSSSVANQFHGTCEPDYYARAMALVRERVGNPEFFAFSDDPDWARRNLEFPGPVTFVSHNAGDASWADMLLMSLCRHHVIANSSFSWWGAWLDPRPDKLVVAPERWVRDPHADTSDLIPRTWRRC